MKITPKSEAEAKRSARAALLRPGWYPGRILTAEDTRSKAGNDMIALIIGIADDQGDRELRDWLLGNERGALKLRHACDASGIDYDSGDIDADQFVGREITVRVGVEKKRGLPDRNIIEDYRAAPTRPATLRVAG